MRKFVAVSNAGVVLAAMPDNSRSNADAAKPNMKVAVDDAVAAKPNMKVSVGADGTFKTASEKDDGWVDMLVDGLWRITSVDFRANIHEHAPPEQKGSSFVAEVDKTAKNDGSKTPAQKNDESKTPKFQISQETADARQRLREIGKPKTAAEGAQVEKMTPKEIEQQTKTDMSETKAPDGKPVSKTALEKATDDFDKSKEKFATAVGRTDKAFGRLEQVIDKVEHSPQPGHDASGNKLPSSTITPNLAPLKKYVGDLHEHFDQVVAERDHAVAAHGHHEDDQNAIYKALRANITLNTNTNTPVGSGPADMENSPNRRWGGVYKTIDTDTLGLKVWPPPITADGPKPKGVLLAFTTDITPDQDLPGDLVPDLPGVPHLDLVIQDAHSRNWAVALAEVRPHWEQIRFGGKVIYPAAFNDASDAVRFAKEQISHDVVCFGEGSDSHNCGLLAAWGSSCPMSSVNGALLWGAPPADMSTIHKDAWQEAQALHNAAQRAQESNDTKVSGMANATVTAETSMFPGFFSAGGMSLSVPFANVTVTQKLVDRNLWWLPFMFGIENWDLVRDFVDIRRQGREEDEALRLEAQREDPAQAKQAADTRAEARTLDEFSNYWDQKLQLLTDASPTNFQMQPSPVYMVVDADYPLEDMLGDTARRVPLRQAVRYEAAMRVNGGNVGMACAPGTANNTEAALRATIHQALDYLTNSKSNPPAEKCQCACGLFYVAPEICKPDPASCPTTNPTQLPAWLFAPEDIDLGEPRFTCKNDIAASWESAETRFSAYNNHKYYLKAEFICLIIIGTVMIMTLVCIANDHISPPALMLRCLLGVYEMIAGVFKDPQNSRRRRRTSARRAD